MMSILNVSQHPVVDSVLRAPSQENPDQFHDCVGSNKLLRNGIN